MSRPQLLLPLIALILASLACSLPGGATPAPAVAPVTETVVIPTNIATVAPPTPTTAPGLTLEQTLNAAYQLPGSDGNLQTFQLTDGAFQNGSDGSAPNFASIFINPGAVALGDLNDDGVGDAVAPIGIGYGGSGTFVYLAALINQGGMPVHNPATTYGLGDRTNVTALEIADGKIYVTAILHGPNDPLCCPSVPTSMIFEYNEMGYRVLHWTTTAPSGLVREINITDPAPEAQIGASLTLRGKTSVGPFENTLVYRIYAADGMAVTESSLMVTNTDIGQPSTFELPLDFAALGLHGRIRVEVAEMSMADGSVLMLDSIYLNVP